MSCPGLLFLIGCFWDNGHLYRADQPSPLAGHPLPQLAGHARRRPGICPQRWGECPSRAAGERAEAVSQPQLWCLLSRLRRRQPQLLPEPGPGPARALVLRQRRGWSSREATLRGPALPRYPPQTPRPGLPRSCRSTRRARAAARRRPAPPPPALSDWPGLSPGRETRSLLAGAARRNKAHSQRAASNNRGQLGPALKPSSAPGTPLGSPRKVCRWSTPLARPSVPGAGLYSVLLLCAKGTLSQPSTQFAGSKIKEKFSDLPKAVAGSI